MKSEVFGQYLFSRIAACCCLLLLKKPPPYLDIQLDIKLDVRSLSKQDVIYRCQTIHYIVSIMFGSTTA